MNETEKKENDTIKQILYNNKYGTAILNKVKETKDVQERKEGKTKQDGLNSHMLEDRPNLLLSYSKTLNLKVSFKTDNNVGKLLAQNKNISPNKFNKCGINQ